MVSLKSRENRTIFSYASDALAGSQPIEMEVSACICCLRVLFSCISSLACIALLALCASEWKLYGHIGTKTFRRQILVRELRVSLQMHHIPRTHSTDKIKDMQLMFEL